MAAQMWLGPGSGPVGFREGKEGHLKWGFVGLFGGF